MKLIKRWNFFLLRLAVLRRVVSELRRADRLSFMHETHRDRTADTELESIYPNAVSMRLVINGRPSHDA